MTEGIPGTARIEQFVDAYNHEVYRYEKQAAEGPVDVDSFVDYSKLKWDRELRAYLSSTSSGLTWWAIADVGCQIPDSRFKRAGATSATESGWKG